MIRDAEYHVVWRVYPQLDLVQMSGVLTGLADLVRQRAITFAVEHVDRVFDSYLAMELIVTHRPTSASKRVVLDFYDRADQIYPEALEFSEVYFKRQFGPETVRAAHDAHTHKVRPLGLTVAGFSLSSWAMVRAAMAGVLRTPTARQAHGGIAGSLQHAARQARLWLLVPPPDSAAARPTDTKVPHVVFQPRLWATTPGSGDVFDVANEDRIRTVQALRSAFPEMATIGLVDSAFAGRIAPDLLLSRHVTTAAHHRHLRTSRIAVNCVGLSGSVGWKLAEYMAAGCAVVGHRMDKQFLAPIEEGVHYLGYDGPEDCVAQCRRLLADAPLAARIGAENRAYFDRWVNPPAHVAQLLHASFEA